MDGTQLLSAASYPYITDSNCFGSKTEYLWRRALYRSSQCVCPGFGYIYLHGPTTRVMLNMDMGDLPCNYPSFRTLSFRILQCFPKKYRTYSLRIKLSGHVRSMSLHSAWKEYIHILMWGCMGIATGRLVDHACGSVKNYIDEVCGTRNKIVCQVLKVLCQLMLVTAIPVILIRLHLKVFVEDWQISIAGLFFAAFFLGMQANLISTAQAI